MASTHKERRVQVGILIYLTRQLINEDTDYTDAQAYVLMDIANDILDMEDAQKVREIGRSGRLLRDILTQQYPSGL